jgi:diketogulonate reductase-like aldo/keto reductase
MVQNTRAFAALKADGSIKAWGDSGFGGTGAPAGHGYTKIYSTEQAFATLKVDGSIKAWGYSQYGGRVHLSLQNLSHPTP